MQRYCAILKLNEKGGTTITSRKCLVYGNKLSRTSLLLLARKHNEVNEIQRETTFGEVAASCRRLLFCHFSNGQKDDGLYMPTIPRYNSDKYRAFKKECVTFLHGPRIVSEQKYS